MRTGDDDRRVAAEKVLDRLLPDLAAAAAELGPEEADAFLTRVALRFPDAWEALQALYGADVAESLAERLLEAALRRRVERGAALRRLDRRREIDPEWFLHPAMVGYVCYADRFAGSLAGVGEHLDYLDELGVTYLHLMPLLEARAGANDGGYAVTDYGAVDPRLGTMADLETLSDALHERGMSLCIDLVLNHTAREHGWARRAMAGDATYRRYYLTFPDRTEPDAYEATLPEVFPDFAPGNFTWEPAMDAWVWTTFHGYQWDLDYSNPDVFAAMADVMLALANHGVDVLRLDAVPFMWKRMGTDSQNQPEVHLLLQAFRAFVGMAAPGVIFKAEAIVAPDDLVPYLGGGEHERPECDLAYHNQLMVLLWSSLASRDTPLMVHALRRMRPPPLGTGWVTYVRCHDDIGWAVSDEDAAAVGFDGPAHRRFLSEFYAGRFPGSFADGVLFQDNPLTGDARISGMAASLCGIDAARRAGDDAALELALRRLALLSSIAYSYQGIPLVYMGDELALANAPTTSGDNRWIHRPVMDWSAADRRRDPSSVEARAFTTLARLAGARKRLGALRTGGSVATLDVGNRHVFAYVRRHPRSDPFLAVANFSETVQWVDGAVLAAAGFVDPVEVLRSNGDVSRSPAGITLPPLGYLWLSQPF